MKRELSHVVSWLNRGVILLLVMISCRGAYAASSGDVIARVLGSDGKTEVYGQSPKTTPLGSLYKLYVYAYLQENSANERPYTCKGSDPEEIFCCSPGETIERDVALAKSCSPYFSFQRLGISESAWSAFWKEKTASSPSWLLDSKRMKPETVVEVDGLLKTLVDIRKNMSSFNLIEKATLGTVLSGTAANSLKTWGTTLRVKTFTWRDENTKERIDDLGFTGGFAGWLPDGSAIWVSRAGHGRDAFQSELKGLVASHLSPHDSGCVEVKYFDRYPIAELKTDSDKKPGQVSITFKNGNKLAFKSDSSMRITRDGGKISVTATMSTNEYVARVLDREVASQPIDAARAFTVAIRTYLYQNSKLINGCRQIADSTRLQRVSPSSASPEALAIARWSDGLTLDRVKDLRYHSTIAATNRMSWTQARDLASGGYSMPEILKTAYPNGQLTVNAIQNISCQHNDEAARWIHKQSKRWRNRLLEERGFELPTALKICKSPDDKYQTRVFSNLDSQEIYVPRIKNSADEISIVHEYLHISFRNHPKGQDEDYIEKLARSLQE